MAESRKALRKIERRRGKQKGFVESRKPLTKVGKPSKKLGKPLRKIGYFTTYLIYPAIFMVHTDYADNDAHDTDDTDNTNGF